MKILVYNALGFALLVAAVSGILVSLAGLIVIIRVQKQATVSLTSMLELLDRTLTTTENGFEVADNAVADSIDALESLQTTVDSVEVVMGKTLPTLDSISELIGTKLPSTIRSTRGALNVAQTAAALSAALAGTLLTALQDFTKQVAQSAALLLWGLARLCAAAHAFENGFCVEHRL